MKKSITHLKHFIQRRRMWIKQKVYLHSLIRVREAQPHHLYVLIIHMDPGPNHGLRTALPLESFPRPVF